MPFVHVHINKQLNDSTKDELQKKIGSIISLIPGKTIDNCMIELTHECPLYKGGTSIPGAFVDVRLFTPAPNESKQAFLLALYTVFHDMFGVEKEHFYVNFLELSQWGSGDKLSST